MATKRTLSSQSAPISKKRRLNEPSSSDSLVTVPLSTASPSANPSAQPQLQSSNDAPNKTMTPPTRNPQINDINIETKTTETSSTKPQITQSQNDKTSKANEPNTDNKPSEPSSKPWKFTASDFTFGNNSWVKQSSDMSETEANTNKNKGEAIAHSDTNNSFDQFAGLGFKQVLSQTDTDKKEDSKIGWNGAWSHSNADGTFKLNFNWGSWDSENAKIDLNPSTKIGWESTAVAYDPNETEQNSATQKVVRDMGGQKDSGDGSDETHFALHCKVYNLDNGKYIERGQGIVNLNVYALEGSEEKRARILCRRDQILTTIMNAPILKETKFEKVGSFVRFGVVERAESDSGKSDESESGDESKKIESNVEEDIDLVKTSVKTYLVRPSDKTKLDTLIEKIKEIQGQLC